MPEVTVAELEPRLQKQVESARAAFDQGRHDHVIENLATVLREQPSCLAVRRLLRAAQLRLVPARAGLFGRLATRVSSSPFVLTGALLLKQQPLKAIVSADRVLLRDPGNVAALTLLGEGATALGWTETAVFAFEAAREREPGRPERLLSLGRALLGAGRAPEAVKVAEELLRLQPANALAVALLRDAAVAVTLAQGRWEQAGDFRGKQAPAG